MTAGAWRAAARVYLDRRVLSMWFLGFSSGLPFGVLAEPLTAWLAESGVSKTEIGLFALVSLPYSLKFLTAPWIDRMPLPLLTRWLGRRRGWALLAQVVLLAAIAAMGFTDPAARIGATAAFALAVAFASASQDVVIDAYRVEILEERKLAAGAATAVFGWRIGQVGAAAVGLILAEALAWPVVFAIMAAHGAGRRGHHRGQSRAGPPHHPRIHRAAGARRGVPRDQEAPAAEPWPRRWPGSTRRPSVRSSSS